MKDRTIELSDLDETVVRDNKQNSQKNKGITTFLP